jgi:hypothetical protein
LFEQSVDDPIVLDDIDEQDHNESDSDCSSTTTNTDVDKSALAPDINPLQSNDEAAKSKLFFTVSSQFSNTVV